MTSDQPAFDRWDIAVALFPFTDIDIRKPRPVLVLSDQAFNTSHGHFVAAMITSGLDSRWPSDCAITDPAACGLKHASVVRWKLFTLPLAVAPRRIGALGTKDRSAISKGLERLLPHGLR